MKLFTQINHTFSYRDLFYCLSSHYFLSGIALAILTWLLDPLVESVVLNKGKFKEVLLYPDSHEVYMRSSISIIILIYSYIIALIFHLSKKTKQELTRLGKLLQEVINSSQDLIYVKDTNLRITLCNDAYAKSLNKQPEEIIGKNDDENGWHPILEYSGQEQETNIQNIDVRKVLAGTTVRFNFRLEGKNNETRYYETIKTPFRNEKGNIIGLLGISRDITEQRKSEIALLQNELRLREAQELAELGNWYWNVITGEVEWSDEVYHIFRQSPDTFIPHIDSIMALSPWPEESKRHEEIIQRAIETKLPGTFEQRFLRPDNSIGTYYSTFQAVFDENDELVAMKGTVQDITESKQAEASLRESEEKFRAIYESTDVGIALCEMDGTLVEMNQGYLNIIGYTEKEAKQLSYWDLTPEEYAEQEEQQLSSLHKTGKYGPYEKEYIHKEGHRIPVLLNGMIISTTNESKRIWSIVQDISYLKQVQNELSYNASHDLLTGLYNRREFENRIKHLFSTFSLNKSNHALLYMDLDQFKIVNDTCGHIAGDELLKQLSIHLQKIIRKHDTLARLGGDEFAVLMEDCSLDDAQRVAKSILKAVEDFQFHWEEHSFKLGISIGLVSISENTPSITELLKDADTACYTAKEAGRNRIHVYNADDSNIALRQGEMQWVTRLYRALDENRFILYAQPIMPLNNSNEKHFEILLRMLDEDDKIILPGSFLSAAERYNLISKIDYWVIEKVFNKLNDNPSFLTKINFCSINLSGQSLNSPEILELITKLLSITDIPGSKICFEITETAAISNLAHAMEFISTLRNLNCKFALDDFGSGLSSFAYLKNLPVDYIKIDGIFIKDIVDDPIDHAMVKSINEIGQVMGMKTIAEFVENDLVKGMLKEIGVNYVQGYGIEKPLPFNQLLKH